MRAMNGCIRVLVSSADPLVRESMVGSLRENGGIELVGQASNGLQLMEYVHKSSPDVLVYNEDSTNGVGIWETLSFIHQKAVDTKVILTIKDYDEDKELNALRMGVRGFLLEGSGGAGLAKCVRAVSRGEMWVRRKVMERFVHQLLMVIQMLQNDYPSIPSTPVFSRREMDIMMMVGRGCRNKEIGRNLHLSEKTVKHYVSQVFKKLHVRKRGEVRNYLELLL